MPSQQPSPAGTGQRPQPDQLAGLVERVTFHSDESGYCVLRIKARGHRDLVTVVGTLPEVRAGEWLEAQGRWIVNKEYGRQFQADILRTMPPTTVEGIEKYLASGMIKGIGPVLAGRIVNVYKERTFEVIDADPHSLTYVEGIGPTRKKKITAAWQEQKAIREIMVFLHGHKVSTSRAFRIFKAYGNEAIAKVRQDPYRLARDIQGIGFKTADVIAESVGIGKQSDLRARAGVEYALLQLTEKGHCGYGREELVAMAVTLLEIPDEIIQTAVEYLLQDKRIVARTLDSDAGEHPAVFLAGLDQSEKNLAESLIARQVGEHPCPEINLEKAIAWVEDKTGLQLAAQQRQAIELACRSKVLVITGGPGVGKTTIINSIVKIMQAKKLKVMMAAPTGRAAKRMAESTGCEAKTIHRLLVFQPKTYQFKHNARDPLEGDVFIIDETSMLDITLAWQLVRAIPHGSAVILVGDVDQLPSVGPGSVLRDIIDSGQVPVCRLTEVFRQAARSAIVTNAHRINQGEMPVFPRQKVESPDKTDFYFVDVTDPDKAVDMIRRMVCEYIPQKFGFDRVDDIQVLSPMQRGTLGCRNLNTVLQEALNPSGPAIQRYGWTFRVGDKVMQMVNDYDKEVFARYGECVERVLSFLSGKIENYDNNPMVWMECFAAHLAGEMRLEESAPLLVNRLRDDGGDLMNEECMYSLTKIGTDRAVEAICAGWPSSPDHYRMYASSSLRNIHCDMAVVRCLDLYEQEASGDFKVRLLRAVLASFSLDGIEPARQLILQEGWGLHGELLAVALLAGVEFSELEQWKAEEEAERLKQRREMLFSPAPKRRAQPAAPFGDLMDPAPVAPITRKDRVSRNDPCPCGSGKKYKKCCINKDR